MHIFGKLVHVFARKLVSRTSKQVSRNLGPSWQPEVYNDTKLISPKSRAPRGGSGPNCSLEGAPHPPIATGGPFPQAPALPSPPPPLPSPKAPLGRFDQLTVSLTTIDSSVPGRHVNQPLSADDKVGLLLKKTRETRSHRKNKDLFLCQTQNPWEKGENAPKIWPRLHNQTFLDKILEFLGRRCFDCKVHRQRTAQNPVENRA